jgi:hypothetical protein
MVLWYCKSYTVHTYSSCLTTVFWVWPLFSWYLTSRLIYITRAAFKNLVCFSRFDVKASCCKCQHHARLVKRLVIDIFVWTNMLTKECKTLLDIAGWGLCDEINVSGFSRELRSFCFLLVEACFDHSSRHQGRCLESLWTNHWQIVWLPFLWCDGTCSHALCSCEFCLNAYLLALSAKMTLAHVALARVYNSGSVNNTRLHCISHYTACSQCRCHIKRLLYNGLV